MSAETHHTRAKEQITLIGLLVNVALAGTKLIAGILGHSYALVADAVESITDILGSAVIWSGVRVGSRPPDENHPYGHGKAEALAAMVVAAIVFLAGVGTAVASIREILIPHHSPAPFTLAVLVVVIALKETMFRWGRRVSKRVASDVVAVDAFHHRADALTSAAAFFGILLSLVGPRLFGGTRDDWAPADDYAALFAAGIIIYNAYCLGRLPLRELMDHEPTEVLERARAIAQTIDGVLAIEKTRARTSGSRAYIDMHVQVNPSLSVAEGHIIAGKVRAAIRAELPVVADVLIHLEPHAPAPEPTENPPQPAAC